MWRANVIAAVALCLLPGLAAATVTCTVEPGDEQGEIVVTVTSSNNFVFFNTLEAVNAQIGLQNCANGDGSPTGNNPCFWEAIQIEPGPASAQVRIEDEDGEFVCGPFTNEDGLPVELVEASVE